MAADRTWVSFARVQILAGYLNLVVGSPGKVFNGIRKIGL